MQKRIKTIQIAAFVALVAVNVIAQACSKILKEEINE